MGTVKPRVEEFARFLRRRGLRVTRQRLAVAKGALATPGHFTAKELMGRLPQIPKATIYRTLGLLVEGGFLTERSLLGAGKTTYEAVAELGHIHIVCIRCGRVWETERPELGRKLEGLVPEGFKVLATELVARGICRECQRNQRGGLEDA